MKHQHVDRSIKKINDKGEEWIDHTCECGLWTDWTYTQGKEKGTKVPLELL